MNVLGIHIPWELIWIVVWIVILLAFIGINVLILVLMERKVAGHFQRRPGPFEVGPHGILQTVADAVKMMGKQIPTPRGADKILFWLAPIITFAPVAVSFMAIPFGSNPLSSWGARVLAGWDVNLGIVLILAFSGIGVLGLCLAGWSSNNKYSLIGAARAVSQSVAYEIPLLLAVLSVAFQVGSLSLSEITMRQGAWPWQWLIVQQPVAFLIFFVSMLGETNRAPFDLPEAESELTGGFHTEYAGMGFGVFFMAEYAAMMVICSVGTVLFLGGFKGPVLNGPWWFLLKVYGLLFTMMWLRWTFPRVRFDQLLNINWKWLTPLALLNLLVVALVVSLT
jgi:NADH-quinone oxidoreductase subunit H